MIKNMFTQNLVETAQLATNFMSGDKGQKSEHVPDSSSQHQHQYHLMNGIPNPFDLQ